VVDRSVVGGIERAADILGHLDVFLHSSAGDEGRIKAGKDFLQWQRNRDTVPIRFGRENARRSHAEFAEGNFYGTARELRKNFFNSNRDGQIAHLLFKHARLKFERQGVQNGLQRYLNHARALACSRSGGFLRLGGGSGRRRCETAGRGPSILPRGAGPGGRRSNRLDLGSCLGWGCVVILGRCRRRFPQ